MEFTGKVAGINQDYMSGKFTITFTVNERSAVTEGFDKIKDVEKLDIKAVRHYDARSSDANKYFHKLCRFLANALTISEARCKNILISRYGQPQLIDDEPMLYKTNAPVSYMLELQEPHTMCCGSKIENDKEVYFYRVYRGSHTYNTAEMSILIDGTIAECKEQGIETIPPDELERMIGRWKPKE
jgi:hypothetical protein